jgi:hypothetical protein
MGIEENNKELIRHQVELYNQHKLDAADDIYGRDCFPPYFTWEQNKEGDIMYLNAFPDVKFTILEMIAEGDKVAYILNTQGTHTGGHWMGIPATGKRIDRTSTYIVSIADNKIIKLRGTPDGTMPQQLGVMPTIPEAIQAYKETHNIE